MNKKKKKVKIHFTFDSCTAEWVVKSESICSIAMCEQIELFKISNQSGLDSTTSQPDARAGGRPYLFYVLGF